MVSSYCRWNRFRVVCGVLAFLLSAPGCAKTGADVPTAVGSEVAAPKPAEEIWDAFYLQNSKVGYGQTTTRRISRSGKEFVEMDSFNHLALTRFGQRSEQDLKMTTLETPEGELLEFKTEVSFGPTPLVVTGHVEGQQLVLETKTKGNSQTARIPWSKDIRGFRAIEQSLEQEPMKPGEKRTLKMLMPVLNQVAGVELAAKDLEETSVLGAKPKLLRVESVAKLPGGNEMASTIWTDPQGQAIKTRMEAMQQESFRTTRQLAIAEEPAGVSFDLGSDVLVKLDKPLTGAHQSKEIRYRVELAAGDPAKAFASGTTQSVRSLGPHLAEVTVRSVRPGDLPPGGNSAAAPTDKEYTTANNVLQIDDPRIKAMAKEARGAAKTPRDVAVALERYVHRAVTKKNFSQAFATAAEVAESREGDCTEHAVLLAALARACEIPARVAMGLVYVANQGGFGYHMWTEVYLDGQWIPLDATLGEGGIGAGHLKLSDSSLDGAAAYSTFLPVAQVVGQLKVSVEAVK